MLVRAHYKETGVGVVLRLNATVVGHWLIPRPDLFDTDFPRPSGLALG